MEGIPPFILLQVLFILTRINIIQINILIFEPAAQFYPRAYGFYKTKSKSVFLYLIVFLVIIIGEQGGAVPEVPRPLWRAVPPDRPARRLSCLQQRLHCCRQLGAGEQVNRRAGE